MANQIDYSYLMRGIEPVSTTSSVLVSSSKYLNDPRLRDWVSTHLLRRNGPDVATPSDAAMLDMIIQEIVDVDHINELFAAERKINPALDSWFAERHISRFDLNDLKDLPEDSLGGILRRHLVANNLQIYLVPVREPRHDYDYFRLRTGQTHDFEHIVGGGSFDFIGELVPYYMRLIGLFAHLSAELAGALMTPFIFGSTRIVTRALLHYPQTWLTVQETIARGSRVGRESGPFFMARYEDVLHLPLAEARAAIGIRGAVDIDTGAASAEWN